MSKPIAYTYEADTHCPGCTLERFGFCPPSETQHDREGNPVGAVFPWDEWHEPGTGAFTLVCGTCGGTIDSCEHPADNATHVQSADDPCTCEACDGPACPNCGAATVPGEGVDGMCADCTDTAESGPTQDELDLDFGPPDSEPDPWYEPYRPQS